MTRPTAVFIPTLNEEENISDVIEECLKSDCDIFVVDGGSTDRTLDVVERFSASGRVFLVHNPLKIQAAGMNILLEYLDDFDSDYHFLVRLDAHSKYPKGFVDRIVGVLKRTCSDSVVVPMKTLGGNRFQNYASALFNSVLGSGGAAHRTGAESGYVDHGHHAGFTLESLRNNGGYDAYFVANEDAEYDYRLAKNGGRIYMSIENEIGYFPRSNVSGLYKQYVKYGFYRAANLIKHRAKPKLRQMLPVAAFLSLVMFSISLIFSGWISWIIKMPFLAYLLAVFFLGLKVNDKLENKFGAMFVGVVSHLSFGFGFVTKSLGIKRPLGV